eukprot:GHVN01021731.1.p1 GENE.GHVN01021731.1~~GHVN01021731.1.p1  ORF type:complete len:221 (-),score=24.34 GHVN01021731.1:107-769(-)
MAVHSTSDTPDRSLTIEATVREKFLPALLRWTPPDVEREVFTLPTQMGGLAIPGPHSTWPHAFQTFLAASSMPRQCIKEQSPDDRAIHQTTSSSATNQAKREKQERDKVKADSLTSLMDETANRVFKRIRENKMSGWLSALPSTEQNHDLNPCEFRDSISIRYGRPFTNLPVVCDGCKQPMTSKHALECEFGGLVILRHNEVRDTLRDVLAMAYQLLCFG